MGKVKDAVKKHIKNGDVIACDVEADFTIVAGKGFLEGGEGVEVWECNWQENNMSFQPICIDPFFVWPSHQ